MITFVSWLTGEQGWLVIGGFVIIHELKCDHDQLLSNAADRTNRAVVTTAVAVVAVHLLRAVPPRYDLLSYIPELAQVVIQTCRTTNSLSRTTFVARPP